MSELIQSFNQALANAREFQAIGEHSHSKAFINLEHFVHWYYFPDDDIFAPAKFIGYSETTVSSFTSHGRHLYDAQEALSGWFRRADADDPGFAQLQQNLEAFVEKHGAHLHTATKEITGGVYVPA